MKAIVITDSVKSYNHFIRSNRLDWSEYPLVNRPQNIHGYRDCVAILTSGYLNVYYQCDDKDYVPSYMAQHSIDGILVL